MRKQCPVCLKIYEGRRDKKTCSEACKKRLQRTPDKATVLKEAYKEAESAIRLLTMYMDDPVLKARAHNSLKALIRSGLDAMPDYERLALATELQQSVTSLAYLTIRMEQGRRNVPIKSDIVDFGGS